MNLRMLTLAGAALLCALPAARAQEPAAKPVTKARNGGYLGIFVREPTPGHVVIERLQKGCGAELAGIQPGDVVLAVDGRPIANGDQLIGRMWSSRPYTLRLRRGEAELEIRTSTKELDNFPQVGTQAPRFTLPRKEGDGSVALDDLIAGGKPVVLIFGSFT
ncbi:MAG: PDZ domain-containing protein [Planctomycetota bacterium]|jgi:membrane-associated protease RseP (regulator of RpoE activity)